MIGFSMVMRKIIVFGLTNFRWLFVQIWLIGGLLGSLSQTMVGQVPSSANDGVLNASLEGTVIDANTGLAINGAVVIVTGEVDKRVSKQVVGSDGSFRFKLNSKQAYQLMTQASGYASAQERLAFTSQYTNRLYGKRIRLTPAGTINTSRPTVILFEKRQARVTPQSQAALENLWRYLIANPSLTVELVGYAEKEGNAALNRLLSEDRAEIVKNFLTTNGIAARRITTRGYGSVATIADNISSRRVEINYK